MKCTEAIARVLKAEGVELMTCFPLNPIIDAVAALKIRPLVARHERVVINIADGPYLAIGEARKLNHRYVGTEHLVIALLAHDDSIPSKVLRRQGLDLALLREKALAALE